MMLGKQYLYCSKVDSKNNHPLVFKRQARHRKPGTWQPMLLIFVKPQEGKTWMTRASARLKGTTPTGGGRKKQEMILKCVKQFFQFEFILRF